MKLIKKLTMAIKMPEKKSDNDIVEAITEKMLNYERKISRLYDELDSKQRRINELEGIHSCPKCGTKIEL